MLNVISHFMNSDKQKISDKQIEGNLWYIKNKALIKKTIIIILSLIILFLYGFSLFKFIIIQIQYTNSRKNYNPITIDFQSWHERNRPKDLIIINRNIIKLGNNNYDIVFDIQNPNKKMAIKELTYKFVYDNEKSSEEKNIFFLPEETKKLVDFNVQSDKIIRTVDFEIINISWDRLKASEIDNLSKAIFLIKDEELHLDNNSNIRNWIEFKVINQSPYNWLVTKFYVSLYLGSKLVAINQITTNEFYSQEEKHLKTSWFYKMPSYVTLKIEPEVNVLNKENYITN